MITPKPWTVRRNKTQYPDLYTYSVLGVNEHPDSTYSGEHFTVASGLDSEEDARLIAAAPALLAACETALDDMRSHVTKHGCVLPWGDLSRAASQLKSAIAAATKG